MARGRGAVAALDVPEDGGPAQVRLSKICATNRPLLENHRDIVTEIDFYQSLLRGAVAALDVPEDGGSTQVRLSKICTTNRPLVENK